MEVDILEIKKFHVTLGVHRLTSYKLFKLTTFLNYVDKYNILKHTYMYVSAILEICIAICQKYKDFVMMDNKNVRKITSVQF